MSITKRSVSLDASVAAAVEHAAADDGVSFSTWLSRAAAVQLKLRAGLAGVAEWQALHGRLTADEVAAGEALLERLGTPRRTRRRRAA